MTLLASFLECSLLLFQLVLYLHAIILGWGTRIECLELRGGVHVIRICSAASISVASLENIFFLSFPCSIHNCGGVL